MSVGPRLLLIEKLPGKLFRELFLHEMRDALRLFDQRVGFRVIYGLLQRNRPAYASSQNFRTRSISDMSLPRFLPLPALFFCFAIMGAE